MSVVENVPLHLDIDCFSSRLLSGVSGRFCDCGLFPGLFQFILGRLCFVPVWVCPSI